MNNLIVIEGLDASGKNTQARLLYEFLVSQNIKSKHISFPDYSHPTSVLAKMYLDSEFGSDPFAINAYAASSFYSVDRIASYIKFWKTNYTNGEIIVSDRYTTSNALYQMPKIPKDHWEDYLNWLYDYEYDKLGLPRPNIVIYLHMPIYKSQHLMNERYFGDNFKKDMHEMNVDFLEKCEKAAGYVLKRDGWKVVKCLKEDGKIKRKEEIHKEILALLGFV